MLKRLVLPIAILLLVFAHVVSAQTETPTVAFSTFPIELRCVGTPTLPPKGWTYPGMILMSGYAGIHAMQADWDTPHVVAQFTVDQQGNVPIDGGQLSPDENWYAAPIGEVFTEVSFNQFWIVRELRLYSLSGNGKTVTLNLKIYQDALSGQTAYGFSPVSWQDNQSLKIGALLIYPFEPAIRDTMTSDRDYFSVIDDVNAPRIISPDLSRDYEIYIDNSGVHWNIYDLTTSTRLTDLERLNDISWRHDSSGFVAQMQQPDQSWHGLINFDRDGKLVDHVLKFDAYPYRADRPLSGKSELQWSRDDRYFALFIGPAYSEPSKLLLVDIQSHTVIDTCLKPLNDPVWSPDGTMFAYLTNAPQNLYLVVVDTKTWHSYIVARQSAAQGLFGAPEMIGWRSTTD